jgi:outer membrane protein, heavy metal efflux system
MTFSICLWLTSALAAVTPLDREAVLAIARERAPVILAARARQGVAEGDLATARAWRHNPELELEVGPRSDRAVRLDQHLDLAGRGARIDAATAGRAAAGFAAEETELAVVAGAARAYLAALHAGRARELTAEAARVQERLHEIAQARFDVGETGALEINLATVALARARAAQAGAVAAEAAALADLAGLLQLTGDDLPGVAGDLAWPAPSDLAAVQAGAAAQPALTGLAARQAQAEALRRLAGAAAWPEVGVFGGWGREDDVDVARFGVNVGLPFFARGQGERQAADAEARAVAIELDAARQTAVDQAARAWQRQRAVLAACEAVSRDATAALDSSVVLAEESYRVGEIALDQVLLVQREQLDARRELDDLQLAAALAAVDVAEIAALPPLVQGETP